MRRSGRATRVKEKRGPCFEAKASAGKGRKEVKREERKDSLMIEGTWLGARGESSLESITDFLDHGEDWAAAAVELSAQCADWAKGVI